MYCRNLMIQVVEIKDGTFCINIYGKTCYFRPMELYVDYQILPLGKKIKGSTLGWYVNRRFVSYNQIKKSIYDTRT